MTPQQIATVRRQFGLIAHNKDGFSAAFYDNLFDAHPTLRPLFPGDMRPQRVKLVQALAHVILSLDNLAAVIDDVRALGMRHAGYGVTPDHYNAVGEALLKTLSETLGDSFDHASESAWALAYGTLADAMIEAADDAALRTAAE
ncbi:globin domain-containing protein [Phreatobacter sp.]|uniref:globin domain-containing protein n=1 Tax=Phreatobacter sp. TaxID=1966341 RepID=UPI003F6EED21